MLDEPGPDFAPTPRGEYYCPRYRRESAQWSARSMRAPFVSVQYPFCAFFEEGDRARLHHRAPDQTHLHPHRSFPQVHSLAGRNRPPIYPYGRDSSLASHWRILEYPHCEVLNKFFPRSHAPLNLASPGVRHDTSEQTVWHICGRDL